MTELTHQEQNSKASRIYKTYESDPKRKWVTFEVATDVYELPKILRFLCSSDPNIYIRIYGDRQELLKSNFTQGCFGYLFLFTPKEDYDCFDGWYGTIMREKRKIVFIPEEDIIQRSYSIEEIEKTSYVGMRVQIVSGDFRKLKGLVTAESQDGLDVDVLIKLMTFSRIINVPKNMVRFTV